MLPVIWPVLLLVTAAWLRAQTEGSIHGQILDASTGRPLQGVNVMLKNTILGSATDSEGRFTISGLPPGSYELIATMIGYKHHTDPQVTVLPGRQTTLSIRMESTVLEQPSLIVTAAKRWQLLENASTTVDVVKRRDIESRAVITLDKVLENVSGVGVIDDQIDIRGSSGFNWAAGSRILLLLDGHPLIKGDTGGINWDAIPTEIVDHVEVVKGAGSALYGSNAMAGMINIITKSPSAEPETHIRLGWGFYDEPAYPQWRWTDRFLTYQIRERQQLNLKHSLSFEQLDLTHSRQIGKAGLLISMGRKRSSGYTENGHYSRWNALAKFRIPLSARRTLTLLGSWAIDLHGESIQWESQSSPMTVPEQELGNCLDSGKGSIHLTLQESLTRHLGYTLKINGYRTDWESRYYDGTDYATSDRLGTELQFDYLTGRHTFTMGTEYVFHHTNSLLFGNREAWDISLYGEDEISLTERLEQVTLNLGVRYDHHHVPGIGSDRQLSPRAGLVYEPWAGTHLRISAGRGFRAPSIAEVYANTIVSGFRVSPNPDLTTAERANSLEIGIRQIVAFSTVRQAESFFFQNPLRWLAANLQPHIVIDAAIFYSQYDHMIDVDLNPEIMALQFMYTNKARNRGWEISLQGAFFKNRLHGHIGYTYIDPEDLVTGKTLPYRSRQRLTTGMSLTLGRWTMGWDYRYASRQEEIVDLYASDERVAMHVMDARVLFDAKLATFGIEARNLRNYHYTLRQRLLEPVRHYVFTCRTTF